MFLLKLIMKMILLPVMLVIILAQWIGIFLTGLAGGILNLLAFLFALVAGASFLLGLSSGPEALKLLVVGFVLFIMPMIAERIIIGITAIRCNLADFIRS
ncbi:MAG: hypothetical protein IJK38_00075 [Oscillospiraceae bacterium]|nr:hypothetical protein [Oscillospiraceae bacterium]